MRATIEHAGSLAVRESSTLHGRFDCGNTQSPHPLLSWRVGSGFRFELRSCEGRSCMMSLSGGGLQATRRPRARGQPAAALSGVPLRVRRGLERHRSRPSAAHARSLWPSTRLPKVKVPLSSPRRRPAEPVPSLLPGRSGQRNRVPNRPQRVFSARAFGLESCAPESPAGCVVRCVRRARVV